VKTTKQGENKRRKYKKNAFKELINNKENTNKTQWVLKLRTLYKIILKTPNIKFGKWDHSL
jgi:hypothetical protein